MLNELDFYCGSYFRSNGIPPSLDRLVRPSLVSASPLEFFRAHYRIPDAVSISLTTDNLSAAGVIQTLALNRYVIAIGSSYTGCVSAEDAIIAHELAHVYMDVHGLRLQDTEHNERLTDTCVILLGGGLVANFVSFQNSYSGTRKGEILVSTGKVGYLNPEERGYLLSKFFLYSGVTELPDPRAVGMRNSDFEPVAKMWRTAVQRVLAARTRPRSDACPRCSEPAAGLINEVPCKGCGLTGRRVGIFRTWKPTFY